MPVLSTPPISTSSYVFLDDGNQSSATKCPKNTWKYLTNEKCKVLRYLLLIPFLTGEVTAVAYHYPNLHGYLDMANFCGIGSIVTTFSFLNTAIHEQALGLTLLWASIFGGQLLLDTQPVLAITLMAVGESVGIATTFWSVCFKPCLQRPQIPIDEEQGL